MQKREEVRRERAGLLRVRVVAVDELGCWAGLGFAKVESCWGQSASIPERDRAELAVTRVRMWCSGEDRVGAREGRVSSTRAERGPRAKGGVGAAAGAVRSAGSV